MTLLKNTFYLLFILASSFQTANATHIIGGTVEVVWQSGNDFMIRYIFYRDCNGNGSTLSSTLSISQFENNTDAFISNITLDLENGTTTFPALGDACFTPPSDLCVEQGVYTKIVTLNNNPNGYYFTHSSCCRNSISLNIVASENYTYYGQTCDPALQNSTPVFAPFPNNGYLCINDGNELDFSATDPDGDDLVYSLITPLANSNGGAKPFTDVAYQGGYSLANMIGAGNPISIDPNTGLLSASPSLAGYFTVGVLIEEFRAGVKLGETIRDINLYTFDCGKELAFIDNGNTPVDADGNYLIRECESIDFTIKLQEAPATNKIIDIEVFGTTTNGVDYTTIGTSVLVPAGDTEIDFTYESILDNLTEGTETFNLVYLSSLCRNEYDTLTILIENIEPLDFTLSGIDLNCYQDASGVIDAVFTGGTPTNAFDIIDAGGNILSYTTNDLPITGVPAGDYTVLMTDETGCRDLSKTISLTEPEEIIITSLTHLDENCNNADGSIDLEVGGIANYTFLWSNGQTTEDISNLPDGTYTCAIINDNNCFITTDDIVILNDNGDISATSTVLNETCLDNLGEITLTPTGGTPNYTYIWANGETTQTISNLSSGTYNYTVVDDNGCVYNSLAEVENDLSTLVVESIDGTIEACNLEDASIDLLVTGGYGSNTYDWSFGSTFQNPTNSPSGWQYVTITDIKGCQLLDSIFIETNAPILDSIYGDTLICLEDVAQLKVDISKGFPPYSYNWSNESTISIANGLREGVYSCLVTDQRGCTVYVEEEVNYIEYEKCSCHVYFPNSYTPNDDLLNDDFGGSSTCDIKEYSLTIYNRWGNVVFESNDLENRWDGTRNNTSVPDGVYVFKSSYFDLNNELVTKSGFINLIR